MSEKTEQEQLGEIPALGGMGGEKPPAIAWKFQGQYDMKCFSL
jgi:hypothetical protein